MKPTKVFFFVLFLLFWTAIVHAQIYLRVYVIEGSSSTSCGDLFDAPDPGWLIQVDGQDWVRYAGNPIVGGCPFGILPAMQYEQTYGGMADVPDSIEICLRADEHDPWLDCSNAQCITTGCQNFAVPTLGDSLSYTLSVSGSSSASVELSIVTGGSPINPPPPPVESGLCEFSRAYGGGSGFDGHGSEVLQLPDGSLLIGGRWAGQAYLVKTDLWGQVLAFQAYGAQIGGSSSSFTDLELAPDGGIVATGVCEGCLPGDNLSKVFVLKTDADLNLDVAVGVKKFGAVDEPSYATSIRRNPKICLSSDSSGYLLASSLTDPVGSYNYGDLALVGLSLDLDSIWYKWYGQFGYFDVPGELISLGEGYALTLEITPFYGGLVKVVRLTGDGSLNWVSSMTGSREANGLVYLETTDELVFTGNRKVSGQGSDIMLCKLNASTGAPLDTLLWGGTLGDVGYDLRVLQNGNLLLSGVSRKHESGLYYFESSVYEVDPEAMSVVNTYAVPNFLGSTVSVKALSVQPLSCDGSEFVCTGWTGYYQNGSLSRPFFHSALQCDDSVLGDAEAGFCIGGSVNLSASQTGDAYWWSTGETSQSIEVSAAGTYYVAVRADCQWLTDSIVVQVYSEDYSYVQASICAGEVYILPDGSEVSEAGVYTSVLQNQQGCDSLVETTLSVVDILLVNSWITADDGSNSGSITIEVSGGEEPYTYLWSHGETGPSVSHLAAGDYEVTVTEAGGCSQVFAFTVPSAELVQNTWEEKSEIPEFHIFPNPFVEQLSVELRADKWEGAWQVRLLDAMGQPLMESVLSTGVVKWETSILPAGVYLLEISKNGRPISTHRLIKH